MNKKLYFAINQQTGDLYAGFTKNKNPVVTFSKVVKPSKESSFIIIYADDYESLEGDRKREFANYIISFINIKFGANKFRVKCLNKKFSNLLKLADILSYSENFTEEDRLLLVIYKEISTNHCFKFFDGR